MGFFRWGVGQRMIQGEGEKGACSKAAINTHVGNPPLKSDHVKRGPGCRDLLLQVSCGPTHGNEGDGAHRVR